MNKKISLIIPVYNALREFKQCIKSVVKNFDFNIGEVIVINDASTKPVKVPKKITLINNFDNIGYLKSCNKAVQYASGEILVFLNSDTEISKGFCEKIIKCFNSDKDIQAASPISSNSANYWIPQILPLRLMNKLIEKNPPIYPELFNAEDFCICVRKSFIDINGLYDEIFSPGYCEEVDLCLRIKSTGGKCVLIDNLYVKHLRHKSFKQDRLKLLAEHNKVLYKRWCKIFDESEYITQAPQILKRIISNSFPAIVRFFIYRIYRLHRFITKSRILTLLDIRPFNHRKNKKRVVYTCLTGNYESMPAIQKYKDKQSRYICFTDNQLLIKLKILGEWEIYPLRYNKSDNVRNARWHKMHPHILFPEYNESLWIDANVDILTSKIFDSINNKNLLIPVHYCRNDIYKEIQKAVFSYPNQKEILLKQACFLRSENMPENYGLNETNIIYRKHNETIKIMEEWWDMLTKYSSRDQASLSYILWKNGIKPNDISIDNTRIDHLNFKIYRHEF